MSLTKKDYDTVAAGIRDAKTLVDAQHKAEVDGMRKVAEVLCAKFRLDHSTFNATKFMLTCGFSEGEKKP